MLLTNSADGGTLGATVSAANSGGASGNAFDSVVGTPTITFDNTHSLGPFAYKVIGGASAQQMVWSTAQGTIAQQYGRLYLYTTGNPSGVTGIVRWLVGGAQAARLRLETTGALTISDAGNAAEITTTNAIALNQWIRIEWHVVFVASNATIEIKLFNNADSATPTETVTSTTAAGLGVNCDTTQLGSFNSSTWTGWMDAIEINDTGYPGPLVRPPFRPLVAGGAVMRAAGW